MLIDAFMPAYDVSEYHETKIGAPIEKVYAALRTTDLSGSTIIRLLLRMRGLVTVDRKSHGNLKLNLDAILKAGFILLDENPPNEIALGLIGRFWTRSGSRRRMSAEDFNTFEGVGYAKAVWNFSLVQENETITRLATETRVRCFDDSTRRRFRFYWAFVAPFSGLIRREALRMIRQSAEFEV